MNNYRFEERVVAIAQACYFMVLSYRVSDTFSFAGALFSRAGCYWAHFAPFAPFILKQRPHFGLLSGSFIIARVDALRALKCPQMVL